MSQFFNPYSKDPFRKVFFPILLFPILFFLLILVVPVSASGSKIAIVQYEVQDLNRIGVDADRLESFIREAASEGAELVVTPETSFYRYEPWESEGVNMLDLASHYEDLKSRYAELAKELNISLVIGLREPSGDPDKPVYNTALFIGPDGAILGKQHKVVPSNAEMKWTRAGSGHSVFETDFGRVGMMICKTAKTNWWNSYEKADNLDLFILIAGDKDARSFDHFSSICLKASCFGVLANQICGPEADGRKGNSAQGTPGGSVEYLGGGETIFYADLPLPMEHRFEPRDGQIMVDPLHPSWLVYNRDRNGDGLRDPYFICGPGDPEGFLYRGTRNPDGTRDGDQSEIIEKLSNHGGNCVYLMAVRTHGGDAWKDAEQDPEHYPDQKHNPWVGQNPRYGLNPDILDQWELWFTALDKKGITIYFFFYDDAIRVGEQIGWPLDEAGELHPGEREFIRDIVSRFEHHHHLVWCIMEEGQEIGQEWQRHISKIAETIRETDDHKHVVATHQLGGNVFFHADDPNIDQFAMQGNWETGSSPDSIHNWLLKAWDLSDGRYNLNMSEFRTHDELNQAGDREGIRKINWASAMAGSYLMVLGMDVVSTPDACLQDCRHLQEFFESTHINYMSPHDELGHAGTQYVLALPGHSYIAYSSENPKELGLRDMTPGLYDLSWYDCVSGEWMHAGNRKFASGNNTWKKPSDFGDEVALYVSRTDIPIQSVDTHPRQQGTGNQNQKQRSGIRIPPRAPDQSLIVKKNVPIDIQLTYSDPDGGPGPYQTIIVIHPSYGKLSGEGNDQTYTPVRGYTGEDIITWKVNDGVSDSDIATIRLKIED